MTPRPPRPASSVLLLRSNPQMEVLMVLRPAKGFFGGLVVFPGGAVEVCDSTVVGVHGDQQFRVAGLRETAEEIGLVVTSDETFPAPRLNGKTLRGSAMLDAVPRERWLSGVAKMQLVSRWVTPESAPSRFDTRFYLMEMVGDPELELDPVELVDHAWIRPGEALEKYESGRWSMILPTLSHLRFLARWSTPAEAMTAAWGTDGLTIVQPVVEGGEFAVRYGCQHED